VLVSLREFQDGKCDIIHKYTTDEAKQLKQHGEIPESVGINVTSTELSAAADGGGAPAEDTGFDFEQVIGIVGFELKMPDLGCVCRSRVPASSQGACI
jgi:hypothetical protein